MTGPMSSACPMRPRELVERIARSVTEGARRAATRDKMIGHGLDPILRTPAEFKRFVQAEREQWLGVARSINFQRES